MKNKTTKADVRGQQQSAARKDKDKGNKDGKEKHAKHRTK